MLDEHPTDRLSAYLDGELLGEELAAVETHCATCAECRATLEGLRSIVRRAHSLEDRPPTQDLWPRIADRLRVGLRPDVVGPTPRRRRFALSVPQLAAGALALTALSAGVTTAILRPERPATMAGTAPLAGALQASFPAAKGVQSYDAAIHELEAALAARRTELGSSTVRTVERSLLIIDRAIAQAQAALARDPNNAYLNGHLRQALERKLDLLRRAAALPAVS